MVLKNARLARLLAALLALVLGLGSACGSDADTSLRLVDERSAGERADLDRLLEAGLQTELPPPMPREERELYEVKLHRQQIAGVMAQKTASAVAPLAVAAAVFAPQGAADLVLSVFPVHHLGKAARFAKKAFRTRALNKRSRKLIALHKKFEAELPEDARSFFQLAQKLRRAERRALETVAAHTRSPSVVTTLMHRHLRKEADLVWLAGKLERNKVDGDFVRRFTFDGDFVKEFTEYEAHMSWDILRKMVEGGVVPDGKRAAMAVKLHGLLGERAAAEMIHGPVIFGKFFKNASSGELNMVRGMGYRTISGRDGSVDIVARVDGRALFVEVKNWAAETWAKKGTGSILAQLKRHDRGIEDIMHRSHVSGPVVGKVLMVAEKGLRGAMDQRDLKAFERTLERAGWKLELIPDRQIASVKTFIDSLK